MHGLRAPTTCQRPTTCRQWHDARRQDAGNDGNVANEGGRRKAVDFFVAGFVLVEDVAIFVHAAGIFRRQINKGRRQENVRDARWPWSIGLICT